MTTVTAIRIGGHAHRYLAAAGRSGHVVSAFRHGLNVLFDEEPDPGFVSIQTCDVPLHPWAVEIGEHADLPDVGTLCTTKADGVRFDGGFRVILPEQADELTIEPYSAAEAERARGRWTLLMDCLTNARRDRPPDPFQPEIDTILERWRGTSDPAILLDLIGLGSGSTPSGDDVLVGLLAGWTAFGGIECLAILRDEGIESRTSLPSAQMIRAAVDGSFPEPLQDLTLALGQAEVSPSGVRDSAAQLANQGATSGIAMLAGVVATPFA